MYVGNTQIFQSVIGKTMEHNKCFKLLKMNWKYVYLEYMEVIDLRNI